MGEKLVRDLSFEARHLMEMFLLPPNPGRDWKTLADKMEYSNQQILYFECLIEKGPVLQLISDYARKGKTVSELLRLLKEMERYDVIEELQGHIEKAPLSGVGTEQLQRRAVELSRDDSTICDNYDVFICYAHPDKSFADDLLRTLEAEPYLMKVCIDHRDFLPSGGCGKLETAVKVIEQKCRKVLVILSENFNNCELADFQAKIALRLSPAARDKIVIPVKYRPCAIPPWLQHITYIDYTNEDVRAFFWNKLLLSLGYRNCLP